ncbi:MAG: hypothetical protein ACOX6U_04540 [Oscillospiraceae bacterium]
MTLKEFKAKSRQEKTQGYHYNLIGTIIACIALVLVVVTLLVDSNTQTFLYLYPLQIVIYGIGACLAIIGMVLGLIGDSKIKKDYREFQNSQQ